MTRTRCILASLVPCLLLVALRPGTASGEAAPSTAREEEIEVHARSVVVDNDEGQAVFEGEVRLRHGDLELRCERIVASVDNEGRLVGIEASGGVRLEARGVSAVAGTASYDPAAGVLTLRGQPQLRHASGVLRGRVIVYRARDGRVSVEEAHGVFRLR